MNPHISRKKKYFVFAIACLIAIIIVGSITLKNNTTFSLKTLAQRITYLKYKLAFRGDEYNVTANADSNDMHAIPVLLYHGVTNVPGQYAATQPQFAEEMGALKKAGYSTITIADLTDFLKGAKQLPEKSFLLTFDDARRDSYTGADPVLQALGYTAVMFVPTADSLDKSNDGTGYYLNRSELKTMVASGRWELGSHGMQQTGDSVPIDANGTRADFLSNKMWLADEGRLETDDEYVARVDKELTQSKIDLQENFGIPITSFAYPSSDYGQQSTNNDEAAQAVIQKYVASNYQMAFQQVSTTDTQFTLNYPGDSMLYLHRIEPGNTWNGDILINALNASAPKQLPDDAMTGGANAWKKIFGIIAPGDVNLTLTSAADKSGSGAFLDGTKNWKDYQYRVTVNGDSTEAVTLFARYQDESNNVSCTFTSTYVKASEEVNGNARVLSEVKYDGPTEFKNTVFEIAVNDKNIVCSKDGVALVGAAHDNAVNHGGVGVSIWDPVLKPRMVAFSGMSASAISTLALPPEPKKTVVVIAKPKPKPVIPIPVVTPPVEPVSQTPATPPPPLPEPPAPPVPPPAPLSLPYDATDFSSSDPWKSILGSISAKHVDSNNVNLLAVKAGATNSTSFAELQGSEAWTDYSYAMKVNFISGTAFSLIGRYVDDNNYATCTFEQNGYGRIDATVNGKTTKIAQVKKYIPNIPYVENISYSMTVKGDQVQCIVNGAAITGTIPGMPAAGGIGIKAYNKAVGTSELDVQEMHVSSL